MDSRVLNFWTPVGPNDINHKFPTMPPDAGPDAKLPGGQSACKLPAGARKSAVDEHIAFLGHQHIW